MSGKDESAAKTEIYKALADLNRGFEMVVEALKVMLHNDVISEEFFEEQAEKVEELRFTISTTILQEMRQREAADLERLTRQRKALEEKIDLEARKN